MSHRWLQRVGALAGALALAGGLARPTAAQQIAGATYIGSHGDRNGGFTLVIAQDGSSVIGANALHLQGKKIVGTCTVDATLERPVPINNGHFESVSDTYTLIGNFSPSRPGYVEGSLEVHSHTWLEPSAHLVDPDQRNPHDQCNVDETISWNAQVRDRDLANAVIVSTPPSPTATVAAAPVAQPTPTLAAPTPTPLPPTPTAPPISALATTEPTCDLTAWSPSFAPLAQAVGSIMGTPVECEHRDPITGDVLQASTSGLSFASPNGGVPTFTNGYEHWALTSTGVVTWVGQSSVPPAAGQAGSGGARSRVALATWHPRRPPGSAARRACPSEVDGQPRGGR